MAVYDIAARQVLPQPVTSAMEGKAARIAMRNNAAIAQMNETAAEQDYAGQELDLRRQGQDLKKREIAVAEQNAAREYLKTIRDMNEDQVEQHRNQWARASVAYEGAMESGNEELANQILSQTLMETGAVDNEDELPAGLQLAQMIGPKNFFRSRYADADSVLSEKAPTGEAVNVMLPDGSRQAAIEDEQGNLVDPETRQPLPKGTTMISQQITTDDPSTLTSSQRGRRLTTAMDSYEGSADINEAITNVLPKIIESPGTAGTSAKFAEFVGAGATYLMGEEAGDRAAELFSGVDQEELAKIRTQMQTLRARLRPIVTGEEGTRQSESERQLANQAIGYIDNIQSITDLAQAYPKVIGALKQLMVESYVNQYQKASRHEEVEYPFDLNTEEGMRGLMSRLAESGQDEDTAIEAYERLKKIQNGRS